MPTEHLFEFVLYVIPGFLSVEIYRAVYPAKQKSEFAQVGWSILFSVFIVVAVKWIDKNVCNNQLYSNIQGFPGLRFTLALFTGGILVGLFRVLLHFIRFQLSQRFEFCKNISPDPQSIWAKINQPSNKGWAIVFLEDGSIYMGYISKYTFDPDKDDQDFLLSDAKRIDENLSEKYIVDGIGVYLNTRDVKRIEFLAGMAKTV